MDEYWRSSDFFKIGKITENVWGLKRASSKTTIILWKKYKYLPLFLKQWHDFHSKVNFMHQTTEEERATTLTRGFTVPIQNEIWREFWREFWRVRFCWPRCSGFRESKLVRFLQFSLRHSRKMKWNGYFLTVAVILTEVSWPLSKIQHGAALYLTTIYTDTAK